MVSYIEKTGLETLMTDGKVSQDLLINSSKERLSTVSNILQQNYGNKWKIILILFIILYFIVIFIVLLF